LTTADKLRNPWYDTTCCPPNLERLFESLPGYLYATSRDGVYVNLYHDSTLLWHLEDGMPLNLSQTTNYPWNGDVKITLRPAKPEEFTVYLRWPEWAAAAELAVNGQPLDIQGKRGSFVAVNREWKAGDVVTLSLPMPGVPMVANPRVTDDYGRVAMERGPLVYALEQPDQPAGAAIGDLFFKAGNTVIPEVRHDLLGGVTVLKVPGLAAERSLVGEPLYQAMSVAANRAKRNVMLTFIPYFSVGNREPSAMEVWVPMAGGKTENNGSEGTLPALSGVPITDRHVENGRKVASRVQ
jgi:hypothetical protein